MCIESPVLCRALLFGPIAGLRRLLYITHERNIDMKALVVLSLAILAALIIGARPVQAEGFDGCVLYSSIDNADEIPYVHVGGNIVAEPYQLCGVEIRTVDGEWCSLRMEDVAMQIACANGVSIAFHTQNGVDGWDAYASQSIINGHRVYIPAGGMGVIIPPVSLKWVYLPIVRKP